MKKVLAAVVLLVVIANYGCSSSKFNRSTLGHIDANWGVTNANVLAAPN